MSPADNPLTQPNGSLKEGPAQLDANSLVTQVEANSAMHTIKTEFRHEQVKLSDDYLLVDRGSYLGGKREQFVGAMDQKFGAENWTIGYVFNGKAISRDGALDLYEKSYEVFLRNNPEITQRLITQASEIWDTNVSNVGSGLDWHKQEDNRSHLQDIAIRRALKTMGLSFQGNKLMQVREAGSDFPELSPGKVAFVSPEQIDPKRIYNAGWVNTGTVEDFWQNNKYIFVRCGTEQIEKMRSDLNQSLSSGGKEELKIIEGKLQALILAGGADKSLASSYINYLERNKIRTSEDNGRLVDSVTNLAASVLSRLALVAKTKNLGVDQILKINDICAALCAESRIQNKTT